MGSDAGRPGWEREVGTCSFYLHFGVFRTILKYHSHNRRGFMLKKILLAAALAAACLTASAAPSYYVVVPVPGKLKLLENIEVSLNSLTMPAARVGVAYPSFDFRSALTITGDPAYTGNGVTFSLANGSLPPGMSISGAGVLTGTPTVAGTGNFTLKATYRTRTGEQLYSLFVHAQEGKLSLSASNNFGSVVVANTSTLPVTVANQGDGPVRVLSATSDKAAFTVDASECQGTLAPAQSCRLNVAFTPSAAGSTSATLTVTGNSGPSAATTLTGSGLAQTRVLQPSPSSVGFASTPYGVAAPSAGVILRNTGNSPISISGMTITGGGGDFTVSNTCGSPLAPNGVCDVNVGFTPTIKGARSATLAVQSNADAGPLNIAFSGTGLQGVAGVAPSTLNFGAITEGQSSTIQAVTVSNIGDYALTVSQLSFSAGGFSQTNNCGAALSPGGSCTISVTFKPAVVATYASTLTIANNGQGGSASVSLSGTGTPQYTYDWAAGAWSTPAACGTSTQTRAVSCERSDGTTVADANCTGTKPLTSQSATDYSSCTYAFSYGSWNTPAACGAVTQTRTATCKRSDGTTVANSSCGTPVTSRASTDYSDCTYTSNLGSWGSCSASCGGGTQSRTASCTRSDGASAALSSCGSPATSQACNTQACSYTYAFSYGSWSTPAGCGSVTQTRTASCVRSDGATVANSFCGTPVTSQAGTNYSQCTYTSNLGSWGSCSASCGGGTQSRTASCTRSDGASAALSNCGSPATSQSCNTQACPSYTYSFSYGSWSTPAGCGAVTQTRSASCVRSDGATVANSFCGTAVTSQASSDYSQCTYTTNLGSWGSCSASCGGGTQSRSASCTRSDGASAALSSCGSPATSQSCNTQACASYTWSSASQIGGCSISAPYPVNAAKSGSCSVSGATNSYSVSTGCSNGSGYYSFSQTCR